MSENLSKLVAEWNQLMKEKDAWKKTDAELVELKGQHANLLVAKEQLEKAVADGKRQLNEAQMSENERLHVKFEEGLAAAQDQHQAAIDDLVKSQEKKLVEVAELHKRDLAEKKRKFQSNLQSIQASNKIKIKVVKNQHQENLNTLAKEHKSVIETQQLTHADELELVEKTHRMNVEELKAKHTEQMQMLTGQLAEQRKQQEETRQVIESLLGMAQSSRAQDSPSLLTSGVVASKTIIVASRNKIQSTEVGTSTDIPFDAEAKELQKENEKLQEKLEEVQENNENLRLTVLLLRDQISDANSEGQKCHQKAMIENEQQKVRIEWLEKELQNEQELLRKTKANNECELTLLQRNFDAKMQKMQQAQEELDLAAKKKLREVEIECQNLRDESAGLQKNAASAEGEVAAVQKNLEDLQTNVLELRERLETQAEEFDEKLAHQARSYDHLYAKFCHQSQSLMKAEHQRSSGEQEVRRTQHELTACRESLAELTQKSVDLQESARQALDKARAIELEKINAELGRRKAEAEKDDIIAAAQTLREFTESEKRKFANFQAESEHQRHALEAKTRDKVCELEDRDKLLKQADRKLKEATEKIRQLEETNQRSVEALDNLKMTFNHERAEKDQLIKLAEQRRESVNHHIVLIADLHNQIEQLQRQPQQQQLQDQQQQSQQREFFKKYNKH